MMTEVRIKRDLIAACKVDPLRFVVAKLLEKKAPLQVVERSMFDIGPLRPEHIHVLGFVHFHEDWETNELVYMFNEK